MVMPIGDGCSKGPASTYFGKISLWNENWIKLKISVWWTWTTSCNLNDIKARQGAEIIEIYSIPFKTFLCLIFGQFRWTCHQSHRYPYQVLLTTMRDELYCTPSSRIVNIDYATPMELKVGAHIQWICLMLKCLSGGFLLDSVRRTICNATRRVASQEVGETKKEVIETVTLQIKYILCSSMNWHQEIDLCQY